MRNQWIGLGLCAALLAGCGPDTRSKQQLTGGYTALSNQDYASAYAAAETFLAKTPAGPGTVEALYLKGRALELKKAATPAESRSNLAEARAAYVEALARQPQGRIETYLHTSLGNVAYFQDDYAAAISEWTKSFDKLDADDLKAWVLYRIGVSRQRTGSFDAADAAFAATIERYPNTVPSQRAREHKGARAFFVQVASFSTPAAASTASDDLKRQAVAAQVKSDGKGHTLVLAGPIASYVQALSLKNRLTPRFPDALIVP